MALDDLSDDELVSLKQKGLESLADDALIRLKGTSPSVPEVSPARAVAAPLEGARDAITSVGMDPAGAFRDLSERVRAGREGEIPVLKQLSEAKESVGPYIGEGIAKLAAQHGLTGSGFLTSSPERLGAALGAPAVAVDAAIPSVKTVGDVEDLAALAIGAPAVARIGNALPILGSELPPAEYLYNVVKRHLGMPVETGVVPFDASKALAEGRISLFQATEMDPEIFQKEQAKRGLRPGPGPKEAQGVLSDLVRSGIPEQDAVKMMRGVSAEVGQTAAAAVLPPPETLPEAETAPGEAPASAASEAKNGPEVAQPEPAPPAPQPNPGDRVVVSGPAGEVEGQVSGFHEETGHPLVSVDQARGVEPHGLPGETIQAAPETIQALGETAGGGLSAEPSRYLGGMGPEEFAARFKGVDEGVYKKAVEQALERGLTVDQKVFDKYPELRDFEADPQRDLLLSDPISRAIRSAGGFDADAFKGKFGESDIRALDGHRRGLLRRGGYFKNATQAAQFLKEEGLLPEANEREFIDALADELTGSGATGGMVAESGPDYEASFPEEFSDETPAAPAAAPKEAWPPERLKAALDAAKLKEGAKITSSGITDPAVGRLKRGLEGKLLAIDLEHGALLADFGGKVAIVEPRDLRELSASDKEAGGGEPAAQPKGREVKRNAEVSTGVRKLDEATHQLLESQLLKLKLANQEKGSILAERKVGREVEDRLMAEFRAGRDIRQELARYARIGLTGLKASSTQVGQVAKAIAIAKDEVGLYRAIETLKDITSSLYRKQVWGEIRKILNRSIGSQRVELGKQKMMLEAVKDIDVYKQNAKDPESAAFRKEYLDMVRMQGAEAKVSSSMMEFLEAAARRPTDALSEAESEEVRDLLLVLEQVGALQQKDKLFADAFLTARLANSLISAVRPFPAATLAERKAFGPSLTTMQVIKNRAKKAVGFYDELGRSTYIMRHVMSELDGGGYAGAHVREISDRVEQAMKGFFDAKDRRVNKIKEAVDRLKPTRAEAERVEAVIMRAQEGGIEHYTEDKAYGATPQERIKAVMSVKLTPREEELKSVLLDQVNAEGKVERTSQLLQEMDNRDLRRAKMLTPDGRYFPMMSAYRDRSGRVVESDEVPVAEELANMLDAERYARKNVDSSFTIERTGVAKNPLHHDPVQAAVRFIERQEYYLNMGQLARRLGTVVNLPQYAAKAGPEATELVREYTTLLSKMGGVDGRRRIRQLDALRSNVSNAEVGGRLSAALVHVSALFNGMGEAGAMRTMGGFNRALFSKDWVKFASENSANYRQMTPAEMGYEGEMGLLKARNNSYALLHYVANRAALGVWIGEYRASAARRGLPVDLKKPDAQALKDADSLMERATPTYLYHQMSLVLSTGHPIGNKSVAQALFQFENPKFSRWSYFKHDVWDYSKSGTRLDALKRGLFVSMGVAAELGVRNVSKQAIAALLAGFGIAYKYREDHSFFNDYFKHLPLAHPLVGKAFQAAYYGRAPIPTVDEFAKAFHGMHTAEEAARGGRTIRAVAATTQALEALAAMAGVPFVGQASEITQAVLKGQVSGGARKPQAPAKANRPRQGRK